MPQDNDSRHDGGCLCGKVRFSVTAPPIDSGYCHCRICQKNSGAPVVSWVTFPVTGFSWIAGEPGTYQSSSEAKRQFCAACGSYMVFLSDRFPDEVSVNTASFDNPEAFPPRMHIFTASRISWLHIDDGLPRHADYGDFEK
jgi:hypothetical protein